MNAERDVMSKQLKLRDAKNSYAAEASFDPEPKVDELCQEIMVCSLMPFLTLPFWLMFLICCLLFYLLFAILFRKSKKK